MDSGLVELDASELFENFFNLDDFPSHKAYCEKYWRWPNELGDGFIRLIRLRPELVLMIGKYTLSKNLAIRFKSHFSQIVLGFHITHNTCCSSPFSGKSDDCYRFPNNQCFITYSPEFSGTTQVPAGRPFQSLGIWIDPQLFDFFAAEQKDHFPIELRDTIKTHRKQSYFHEFEASPSFDMVIHQVLNCPYTHSLKRLFLESKVLELITCTLAQFINTDMGLEQSSVSKSSDVERVRRAKDLVSRNIQNPPKLQELARIVGLTHPKLNLCFRKIYGTTVYGYIREMRLNQAKLLLNEGHMNVTEVALEVGYSSLSHFAKAFKDCFGTLPGYYLREKSHQHSHFR